MRLVLGLSLILLFLWLYKAERTNGSRNVCEAASMSEAAVSLLLSPLALYSWLVSTVLRVVTALPGLVLGALHHTLLLLLAAPWCAAAICVSFMLTCFHVALYMLHLALGVGAAAAIFILKGNKKADDTKSRETKEGETANRPRLHEQRVAKKG